MINVPVTFTLHKTMNMLLKLLPGTFPEFLSLEFTAYSAKVINETNHFLWYYFYVSLMHFYEVKCLTNVLVLIFFQILNSYGDTPNSFLQCQYTRNKFT